MQSEKKAGKAWTGYAGLALGIVLIAYLFSKVDLEQSVRLIGSIGFSSLFILIPYLLLHIIETVAWQHLFPPGNGPVPFAGLFRIQIVSETVSMTLPAGVAVGEPLRPWLCRRFLGIPLPDGFASITIRKLLLGAAQGLYTVFGAIAGFAMLQEASVSLLGFGGLGVLLGIVGAAVMIAFLSMLLLMTGGKAVQSLHRLLMLVPFARVRAWLLRQEEGFAETDRKLQSFKVDGSGRFLPVLALYVCAWMMLAFESYLILQLLGVKVTFLQVLAFDTALAMLRAVFFFIPSGLGIQDLGYLAFFQALGIHDYLAYGGAFVVLRRLKEVIWYATGYGVMFMAGINLKDAQQASEESA
ncbi:MAG: flippase-like domain-containing protein [Chlorobiaceae bacterium]|nr:flippase-like domain-containing protein [Chlorobiaceae bacterium]NTW75191.1 flippase-like domain-containing protein [Chlorobiaceae bacterium]